MRYLRPVAFAVVVWVVLTLVASLVITPAQVPLVGGVIFLVFVVLLIWGLVRA